MEAKKLEDGNGCVGYTTGDWRVGTAWHSMGQYVIVSDAALGGIALTIGGVGDEEKANAYMMSAAPNMLDVLLLIRNGFRIGALKSAGEVDVLHLIEAAINKAQGVKTLEVRNV